LQRHIGGGLDSAALAGLHRDLDSIAPPASNPSVSGLPVHRRERTKLPMTTTSSILSPAAPNLASPPVLLRETTGSNLFPQSTS
jgi:hypothetical protein